MYFFNLSSIVYYNTNKTYRLIHYSYRFITTVRNEELVHILTYPNHRLVVHFKIQGTPAVALAIFEETQ